jgi:hypothetical protein
MNPEQTRPVGLDPVSRSTMRDLGTRLLPAFGVLTVALLGVAIWTSTGAPGTPGPPTGFSTPAERTLAISVPANSAGLVISTAHGSNAGYEATIKVIRTGAADGVGNNAAIRLEVSLSTEATPASAPTAVSRLTGSDRVGREVSLTLIGPGHWSSQQLTIAPGRYSVTTRFDRQGRPVTIPVTISVS